MATAVSSTQRQRAADRVLPMRAMVLDAELRLGKLEPVADFTLAGLAIEVMRGRDSVWAIIRRPARGALALRLAYCPGGVTSLRRLARAPGSALHLMVGSAVGEARVELRLDEVGLPTIRASMALTPAAPLLVTHWPRDLYTLGADDDVSNNSGTVEAAQRGLNSGLCYARLKEPAFGTFLYFQNLTALNDYFVATETKPDGAVGGEWPELGYLPPTPPQAPVMPTKPLPAGRETVMSDVRLVLDDDPDGDERNSARRFLRMLGTVYRTLDLPRTAYRDWIGRAEATLKDLETAPEASVHHYGHRYIRPYTAAEYPDSMVQLSIIGALHDWGNWLGAPTDLEGELAAGLRTFHDAKLGSIRRYLPNVGKDKDKDAVDSWYLYHPLMNLAKLALDGSAPAKRQFLKSIDFAIRAARHFNYAWPIQYKVTDFSIITASRNADGLGQTDVGGLYAYVMLQAHELTDDTRYLDEARAAIEAAREMRFELNYQANLTAWGAAACMRLWRITNDRAYLDQSYVYLASFFHNAEIWESGIAHARHFTNFLAVTALHDGPYMALYECFDSFCAFEAYLKDSGPELEPAVRMLVSEYCKYALHRAWFYYPDALPEEVLATDIRNGHIDRKLSFPLEDLYPDGQPAGQVGQEIYGAGAAFAFAARAFHQVEGAPFWLYCDHFVLASERLTERSMSLELGGGDSCTASLSLVRNGRRALPKVRVETSGGDRQHVHHQDKDRQDYRVPANGRLTLYW